MDLPKDKLQQVTQPQEQNTQDTMGREVGVSSNVSERWNSWAGRQRKKRKDRPYSLPIPFFPRLTTHSLLEMQAYHGFLADSNIRKNPRAGPDLL